MSRLKLHFLLVLVVLAAQSTQAMTNQCTTGIPDGYNYQTMIHRTGWDEADYFSVHAWWTTYRNFPEVVPQVQIRDRYFFDGVAGAAVPERLFPMTQYGPLPQMRDWVLPDPPQNVRIFLVGDLSIGATVDDQSGDGPVYYTHASAGTCGASFTFTPLQLSEAVLTSVSPANPTATGRPANSFSVTPAVTSSTLNASDGKKTLSWVCKGPDGSVLTNATFELSNHEATPGSGGHIHSSGRPKGTFSTLTGSAGANGVWQVGYTATEIGGIETFKAKCGAPSFTPNPSTWTAYVEIPGLFALPANPQAYTFEGTTNTHPDSHYGTPEFNNVLIRLAFDFANKFPGKVLGYNDMSLPYGGLFDYDDAHTPWKRPHASHRRGDDVDIFHGNLTNANIAYIRKQAATFNLKFVPETPDNHSHLRLN